MLTPGVAADNESNPCLNEDFTMRRSLFSRFLIFSRSFHSHCSHRLMNSKPYCSTKFNRSLFPGLFFSFTFGVPLCVLLNYVVLPLSLLISIFLLFFGFWFCFRFLEHFIVYACNEPSPSKFLYTNPSSCGFTTWELVKLSPDGKNGPTVIGIFLLQSNLCNRKTCPVVLLLHGNAGNSTSRLPMCQVLESHFQCNIFILDYRGYGQSTGRPSEKGLYADAKCAMDYLSSRTDINTAKIFLFGRSLGGAVAIHLASDPKSSAKICGVIIENTFTSISETASHILNIPWKLPSWLFSNQYSSLIKLQNCSKTRKSVLLYPPMLLISGEQDKIIPPKMMWKLAEAYENILSEKHMLSSRSSDVVMHHDNFSKRNPLSQDPSTFINSGIDGLVSFPEGHHNDTWFCNNWSDVILRFMEQSNLRIRSSEPSENDFHLSV
ncbi:unnamed protein product [Trichobilharzia szidati]|nr:unnamed protein product [Trichobilharzia szidati]